MYLLVPNPPNLKIYLPITALRKSKQKSPSNLKRHLFEKDPTKVIPLMAQ